MSGQRRVVFEISFLTEESPLPMPSVAAVLERVRTSPSWDGATITPVDGDFPRLSIEWHKGFGFVIQCYEDDTSLSDFLLTGPVCGSPAVEIELGGQALERWPLELFVPVELAHRALERFIATGRQDQFLHWVTIDAFPRETIWEGRAGREVWERTKGAKDG